MSHRNAFAPKHDEVRYWQLDNINYGTTTTQDFDFSTKLQDTTDDICKQNLYRLNRLFFDWMGQEKGGDFVAY